MRKARDPEALGRLVAAAQDAALERAVPDEQVRQRLAERAAARAAAPRPRLLVGWAWAPVAAAVAVAMVLASTGRRAGETPTSLTFTVGDPPARGALGELMSAPAARALPIRFSDGTNVLLRPSARARVVGLGPRGAELILESGRARFEITPRPLGHWWVRTGPFSIRVTGTKFETEYDPRADRFRLELHEGHVVVSGCDFGEGRAVSAGQQLTATCSYATAHASTPETANEPPPAPAVATVARERSAQPRSWEDLARQGRYDDAYGLVRAEFDWQCRHGGAAQVWLLGDVARLTDHVAEARRAYLAVRDRFAGTAAAADAAFALGRLALDADGDRVAAQRWFETSLAERPSGAMAPAALGRLMELRLERSDPEGAAALARRYLERYPEGPMASQARRLLGLREGAR